MSELVVAALGAGFLGSFHCAFMCGPLLAAGCAARRRDALPYFAGRAVAYLFAGAVFGQLGAHAAHRFSSAASVLTGIVAALALLHGLKLLFARRPRELVPLGRRRSFDLASLIPRRALPLGLVTGALPCGLLASGWALAAASGHPLHGAIVMLAFSVATAPALAASLLVSLPALRRRVSPTWQGVSWCALALLLALRPLWMSGRCH
jgi:sulfite exporter TauE/SafE